MSTALRSLVESGTKLWLDSIDPAQVPANIDLGITGATSNPIIIADLMQTDRFDNAIGQRIEAGDNDEQLAWNMTDQMVRWAQSRFEPVWEQTSGNDGYVSFELDPLLEDAKLAPPHEQRVAKYVEEGKRWAEGHRNRLIKVPATAAGLEALEDLAAAGISLNVTLIFTQRQYDLAREAVWRGRQQFGQLESFKSVYSIFVSRVDVYTQGHVPQLSQATQGQVGIVNAKRLWRSNQEFWASKHLPLQQEIVFASTGAKLPSQAPDCYVVALAGSDIQTNPPATNAEIERMSKQYVKTIDQMPEASLLKEIDQEVDHQHLEQVLMTEGVAKFADPFKQLLLTLGQKRQALSAV